MHRVLIIGGGSIGERHARCLLGTGRAEVAVCDTRPQVLEALRSKYALSDTFDDYERVDLSSFDVVVVCVPANLHIPYARRAVDAGLHVLIEKPLSVSKDGIDELAQAIEQQRVTVGVAYVRRAMEMYQRAKLELDSGRIGDVLSVVYSVGYDHREARPDYRNTYEVSRATGGGALQDIVSHMVNLVQWFLGLVSTVAASYDHLEIEGIDGEDTASVLMRFREAKALANLHCVMWQAGRTESLVIAGRDGTVHCDPVAGRLGVFLRETNEWRWTEGLTGKRDAKLQRDAPFIVQANNFLDAVDGKADVLCTLEGGRHTLDICTAAFESGKHGRVEEIQARAGGERTAT